MSDHPIAFRSPFNGGTAWVSPETATPDFLAAFEKAGFVRLPDERDDDVGLMVCNGPFPLPAKPITQDDVIAERIRRDRLAEYVKRGPGRPRKQPLTTEG
jgi:hypothetical protein